MRPFLLDVAKAMLCVVGLQSQVSLAGCPTRPTAERFVLKGDEAIDKRTALTWARCSVGQSWSGNSCVGTAITMTHEAALSYAQPLVGWRVPTVKELASLVDKGCNAPAVDTEAFPQSSVVNAFWTSSPYVGNSVNAWAVGFMAGEVFFSARANRYPVRLVRVSP
jgi:hypothetical protein